MKTSQLLSYHKECGWKAKTELKKEMSLHESRIARQGETKTAMGIFGEGIENSIGCKTYKIISQIERISQWMSEVVAQFLPNIITQVINNILTFPIS